MCVLPDDVLGPVQEPVYFCRRSLSCRCAKGIAKPVCFGILCQGLAEWDGISVSVLLLRC